MSKKSSEAGRILAQSCGMEKFRALQRAKALAFWSSPDGKRRKKEMSEHPIRLMNPGPKPAQKIVENKC